MCIKQIYHLEANGLTNTGEYVKNVLKALEEVSGGCSIKVFTSKENRHGDNAISVFGNYGKSIGFIKLFWYVAGWIRLSQILFKSKKRVVFHVHWLRFSPIDFFFLNKIKKKRNVILVFTVHNILPHEPRSFDEKYYRKIYPLFDCLFFHSIQNKIDFNEKFNLDNIKQEIVPHYSYDVEPFVPPFEGEVQLLFFGAIRPYKGLTLLIEALTYLPDSINWHLTIAGKVETNVDHLIERCHETESLMGRVTWTTGWIEEKDVDKYFHNCHVVVLPYLHIDNSGLVHLAMSYGKTVVVPHIGVFRDLIEHGVNGYLFIIKDPRSLASILQQAFEEQRFISVGKAARSKMNKHSLNVIGLDMFSFYQEIFFS